MKGSERGYSGNGRSTSTPFHAPDAIGDAPSLFPFLSAISFSISFSPFLFSIFYLSSISFFHFISFLSTLHFSISFLCSIPGFFHLLYHFLFFLFPVLKASFLFTLSYHFHFIFPTSFFSVFLPFPGFF